MTIQSINPATGDVLRDYEPMTSSEVAEVIEGSFAAFSDWQTTSFEERGARMRALSQVLRDRVEEYAGMATDEMGKAIREARAEIEKCAWVCEFYADQAEVYLKEELVATEAQRSFVAFRPLGPILAVMPWNFPFWQVFRFAAPGLMAGNTGLLKHASNVFGCALAIESAFQEAGFPKNVFRALLVGSQGIGEVIDHPHVKAITLTGSTPAGKAVAARAGAVLKKTVLELGGSDPYLILEDADLDEAVRLCVTGRLINSGQSCVAAKRFLVVAPLKESFEKQMVERMGAAKVGDPRSEETEVGPMARWDLRDELHQQVTQSISGGARCLLGGAIPESRGAFYPPTVLTDVREGVPAYHEELFGPVASIIPVADEAEAIRVANDTSFGLGGAVFTRDLKRGERIAAEELDAGCCFVNTFVKSDPRLPFGGVKESGYGRELSHFGIREFVNIKTVYVQ